MIGSPKTKQHSLCETPIFDDELAVTPLSQNGEFYDIVLVIIAILGQSSGFRTYLEDGT